MKWLALTCSAVFCAAPASADLALNLPSNATETYNKSEEFDSHHVPIGPYSDGFVPTLVAEGATTTKAWQVNIAGSTTLLLMDGIRQHLEASGFELLYECETRDCGGFDFRFSTAILPEPTMHIDLGDFRYLAAQRLGTSVPQYISVIVSRGGNTAFIQMILIGDAAQNPSPPKTSGAAAKGQPQLVKTLLRQGYAVLDDLIFKTGSSKLDDDEFSSLAQLSEYLKAHPNFKVALVGHTDAQGSLATNIALSRQRADAAATYMTTKLGVPEAQVDAEGVGYLAPRGSNLTDTGRRKNRRVEVIITSTLP